MNNKLLLAVSGVVIVGVAAYVMMRGPTSDSPLGGGKMSMKSLLASATAQKCTFTSTAGGSNTSGTVYVASGKMRGDFNSLVNSKNEKSHMIVSDNTSYVWAEAFPQGMKMSFANMESKGADKNAVSVNDQVDFSCTPWSADQSMFAIPGGVVFNNIDAMMPGSPKKDATGNTGGTGNNIKAIQCGACDNLSGNEKSACRSALSC